MSRDQSTVDAPRGFTPWEAVRHTSYYAVQTTPTTDIFIGDLVESAGNTLLTPKMGNLIEAVVEETGAAGSLLGVVVGIFDEDFFPINNMDTADAGNGTIAGYLAVADDPMQEYVAQEDGVVSSLVAADMGLNVNAISTHAGSTSTGISGMEIDSSSKATTATLAMQLLRPHPDDSLSAAGAAGNHCRFIVKLNSAFMGSNVVGV
jgi:hypothetical protein